MKITLPSDAEVKSSACAAIIATLPDWFGIENSNQDYIKAAAQHSAIAAENNDSIIALLIYKTMSGICELHWMGILPEHHRQGIGRQLVTALSDECQKTGVKTIVLETLDPDLADKAYLQTYKFYKKMGFEIVDSFQYDDINRMVKMKLDLK